MVGETDRIMYREVTGRTVLCLAAILLCVSVARADYEEGLKAWNAGRPAEALIQWRNAAAAEDRRAMLRLGRLYLQGLGAPQDYVLAHMWFNLSASRGEAEALRERDALTTKMTPQQIASAQERARAWRPGRESGPPKSAAVPPSTAPSPTTGPPPPHAIREVQGLMAALGYSPGTADGRWGARTAKAYATFLRDAGMPPGNVLTPEGLRAMRAAAKRRNVAAAAAPPRAAPVPQRQAAPPPADLHRLVAAGDVDGLKAALVGGADANARDGKGWTPLMLAVDKGYALMVTSLLEAGADPNLRLADGATALFIGAVHGQLEIVAALMEAGADPSVEGPKRQTALDVARTAGHSEILALPAIVAFLNAEARKKHEEEARRQGEKVARRAQEAARAFSLARSSDTPEAYKEYLSMWCPGAASCAEAGTRRDESIASSLVGKTFGGINSLGDEQVYEFPRMGAISGVSRPSSWTSNRCSGTWRVEQGKIQAICEWGGGAGKSVVTAELEGNTLSGGERYGRAGVASFFGPNTTTWTWRLVERSGEQPHQENEINNPPDDDAYLGGD